VEDDLVLLFGVGMNVDLVCFPLVRRISPGVEDKALIVASSFSSKLWRRRFLFGILYPIQVFFFHVFQPVQ
jgi:hypothetical protein